MKKSLNKSLLIIVCAALMATTVSCEKYLALDSPKDRLETGSVFSDSTSAALAIVGIYSDMMYSNFSFIYSQGRWTGLSADELDFSWDSDLTNQFRDNNLRADNSNLNTLWNDIYKHIYQANSVVEGVMSSSGINESAKETLIGEARFIRAFLFFNAVNYWGDVPLTTSTDYRLNESMPRIPVMEVYGQIVADLEYALAVLQEAYPTVEKVRPNKWAAAALLARVYLYIDEWEKAENLSSAIIASGEYLPLPPLEGTFKKESIETIWQLFPASSISTDMPGNIYIPASLTDEVIPFYPLPRELYESFSKTDKRKDEWIGVKSAGPYYFSYKYKISSAPVTDRSEYYVIFRLAEQYLIRAEARLHLSDLTGAIADLNTIRARAAAGPLPLDLSMDEVTFAIEQERRFELFNDWGGHRWFDLKRTGRADEVLRTIKGSNWQSTDQLWPIPLNQLLTNPSLVQNQGY